MKSGAVLWNVVQRHLEEAEFLFQQWWAATRSPRFSLVDVQKTVERRLVAHLDGLVVGGQEVADLLLWPLVEPDTEASESAVAAAGLALLMDSQPVTRDRLIETFRAAGSGALGRGLGSAFQIAPRSDIDEPLRLALYATESVAAQSALLQVLASHRIDPGPILGALLERSDPDVLSAALNAAAAAAAPDRGRFRHVVEACLSHDVPAVRAAALRTGMIWNMAAAWRLCVPEARAGMPEAMLLLALVGGTEAVSELGFALKTPERRKAALFALGFTGLTDAVDACLPLLDDPDAVVARLAIEAIASITGLPLYEDAFVRARDEDGDGELPPLEEDLRIDLTPVPHDDLPLPDAIKVREWWSERRRSFAAGAGERYLRGAPLSTATARDALEVGPLRRSGALACEIAIRTGGRVQLTALRLAHPKPTLPTEVALHRRPVWQ